MKALVKTKKGRGYLELREIPIPEIKDDEVLIRIEAAGICGTDFHIYEDTFPYWPPVTLGHEFVGTIADLGENVVGWKVGDRVVGEPHTLACGECYLCRTGNPQICASKRSPGWGIDGAFAEYLRWPEPKLLHRIPPGMSAEAAVLTEPLANVVSDVVLNNSVTVGDTVAVAGDGAIGIMAGAVARHAGAREVVLIGHNEFRIKVARSLSNVFRVVDSKTEDAVGTVIELTNGRGADVFVDASGSAAALAWGAKLIKKLGTIVAIGFPNEENVTLPYTQLLSKGVSLLFNVSTKYESWDRSIEMLRAGVIPHDKIVSTKRRLQDWQEIFDAEKGKKQLKTIFLF